MLRGRVMPVGSVKLDSQTNGGNIDIQFHGVLKYFFISVDRIRIEFFHIKKDGLFRKRSLTFCVTNGALGVIAVSIVNRSLVRMSQWTKPPYPFSASGSYIKRS